MLFLPIYRMLFWRNSTKFQISLFDYKTDSSCRSSRIEGTSSSRSQNPHRWYKTHQKLLSPHLHPRSHSHITNDNSHFSNSQAETTITQHSDKSPSIDLSKPLVVKQDGKSYPRNPTNGYVTRWLLWLSRLWLWYTYLSRIHGSTWSRSSHSLLAGTLGSRSQDTEKNLVLLLSRRSPLILSLVTRHLLQTHLLLKNGICRGSHMNKPTWKISDKRLDFSLLLFLF